MFDTRAEIRPFQQRCRGSCLTSKIGIIDYGVGNIRSIENAVRFLDFDVHLISQAENFAKADFLILPGVGAFHSAMDLFRANGMEEPLLEHVAQGKRLLGICLGCQMLLSSGVEFEPRNGLDLIPGLVQPFNTTNTEVLRPNIGWRKINQNPNAGRGDALASLKDKYYYFVHSYFCLPSSDKYVAWESEYLEQRFPAILVNDNVLGIQFHPEKSGKDGLELLKNIVVKNEFY